MSDVTDPTLEVTRGRDLLVFRIGSERFAAPIGAAEEAIDLDPAIVQEVPGDNRALRGVFPLRGALVPLYDAGGVLGTAGRADGTVLLVRPASQGGRVAIAVDDVEDVLTVSEEELEGALRGLEGDTVVRGVLHRGASVIAIVDLNALVAACRAGEGKERV